MGVPVTVTFLLKTTAMSTVSPAPYVPPAAEDTSSTLAGSSGLCGVVALILMSLDPPSDIGPLSGRSKTAGLPAASCMVPPLRDRASMPV